MPFLECHCFTSCLAFFGDRSMRKSGKPHRTCTRSSMVPSSSLLAFLLQHFQWATLLNSHNQWGRTKKSKQSSRAAATFLFLPFLGVARLSINLLTLKSHLKRRLCFPFLSAPLNGGRLKTIGPWLNWFVLPFLKVAVVLITASARWVLIKAKDGHSELWVSVTGTATASALNWNIAPTLALRRVAASWNAVLINLNRNIKSAKGGKLLSAAALPTWKCHCVRTVYLGCSAGPHQGNCIPRALHAAMQTHNGDTYTHARELQENEADYQWNLRATTVHWLHWLRAPTVAASTAHHHLRLLLCGLQASAGYLLRVRSTAFYFCLTLSTWGWALCLASSGTSWWYLRKLNTTAVDKSKKCPRQTDKASKAVQWEQSVA